MNHIIRFPFFTITCVFTWFFSAAALFATADESPSRPNIIFVVADDMGFKDTGYSGKSP